MLSAARSEIMVRSGPSLAYVRLFAVLAVLGVGLLVVNVIGWPLSLRAPEITDDYADFARSTTLSFREATKRLESLGIEDKRQFVSEATRIFHHGMAHIPSRSIKEKGLDYYRMRVPVWENYLLYVLSFVKPDTYRDYEFCSYRKALERGTGRCGQQSMALVGYLAERGLNTGFVHLGGHTVAMAEVAEGEWHMLDPDYGGVVPFGIERAEQNPMSVLPHYWNDAIEERGMYKRFSPEDNLVQVGGPDVRWARACPIERVAYVLKWLIPVLLIAPWVISLYGRGRPLGRSPLPRPH